MTKDYMAKLEQQQRQLREEGQPKKTRKKSAILRKPNIPVVMDSRKKNICQ